MTKLIKYVQQDLLSVDAGIVVHGCNGLGVMGAGIALAIRNKYPECYESYKHSIEKLNFGLGDVSWHQVKKFFYIANAITQEGVGYHKRQVNYEAVAKCFEEIYEQADLLKLPVYFPKIGAGLGGGDWKIISTIIENVKGAGKVSKFCMVI